MHGSKGKNPKLVKYYICPNNSQFFTKSHPESKDVVTKNQTHHETLLSLATH